jgi:diguanylate cyclase (GGDEF)-like protein
MTVAPQLEDLPLGENLPSLPAVALEVLQVAQDDSADVDDLTRVLARDPALSAKVLQMANSPLFSRGGGSITSLQRAAGLLGFRAVKVIALGFSLASELPMRGSHGGFDLTVYWHRSLVNAVVARSLAQATGSRLAEEAFLAGLLADIGKLVIARSAQPLYQPLVEASGGWPDAEVERAVLGFDSVDVAAALLDRWGVPAIFGTAVRFGARFADAPEDASRETQELTRVLQLALRAAGVFFDDDKGSAMLVFTAEAERLYGFGDADVDALMDKVGTGVAETASIFEVALPDGVSYQTILDAARIHMVSLSLDAAANLQQEQQRSEELASLATTDSLTGLRNRAALDEFLARQVHARIRGGVAKCLGLVMIDIDHFKAINDEHGHPGGDAVLRAMGDLLDRLTRTNEFMARFGGEEFALVAPSAEPDELRRAAERLRLAVESMAVALPDGRTVSVTASFGAAAIRRVGDPRDGDRLVERADRQLYLAKGNGRNRVEVDEVTDL